MLTKLITIRNENDVDVDFKINIESDLSSPIPVDSGISIRFCDSDDVSITDLLSDVILTSNNNKTINTYTSPNDSLAVTLYKKEYDDRLAEYTLSKLPQSLLDSSALLYQCNEMTDGILSVFLISGFSTSYISSTTPFKSNTSYVVEVDFTNIIPILLLESLITGTTFSIWSNGTEITSNKIYINLITGTIQDALTEQFSINCNNAIFKLNNLDKMDDIAFMLEQGRIFNYQFNPVKIVDGITQLEVDSNGDPVLIQVDNQTQIEELFLKQYLPEYITFFETLTNETPAEQAQALLELKKMVYPKSELIHASVKGTLEGIQNVLNMFCKMYGNYVAIVEADPSINFVYRITTNLPKYYWTNIIKKMVHPLSWKDEYIFIDIKTEFPNTNIDSPDNYKDILRDSISGMNQRCLSYLDVSHDLPYNTVTTFYDQSAISNFETHFQYGFTPNRYLATIDYTDSALQTTLTNPTNFNTGIFVGSPHTVYGFYDKVGYALEYVFEIIIDEEVFTTITTTENNFSTDLGDVFDSATDIHTKVTLMNKYATTPVICSIQKLIY